MKSVIWAALSAAFVCAACVSTPERDGPSPRAECANETATIYFEPDAASLPEPSARLVADLVQRMNACTGAGGEVERVSIVSFPDERASRREANAEMDARAAVVRDALTRLGVPAYKIVTRDYSRRTDGERAIMQRRAEIHVEMW